MMSLTGHTAPVRSVTYAPGGRHLASGAEDGTVRVWDLTGGGGVQVWDATAGVEALAYSPDGAYLIAGLATGGLIAWNPATGRKRWTAAGHPGGVRAVACAAGGNRVFATGWDRTYTSRPLTRPQAPTRNSVPQAPGAMAVPADVSHVYLGLSGSGEVVTKSEDATRATWAGSGAGVSALALSPDEAWLVAGDAAGGLTAYAAETGAVVRTFVGHTWTIYGLGFTPDGRRLVSGGADGTVRVWDVATGGCLHVFQWHATWVTCLAVAPDGLTVATGGNDRTVAVWDMPE